MYVLGKIFKWLCYACAWLLMISFATVMFFSVYRPEPKKADAIIVLGAAINTPALYNRAAKGLELYQKGKADTIVLSGGRISSKYVSEASNMQHVMDSLTPTPPVAVLEEDSHNTYENLKNSRSKIPNVKSVIIVSDAFHLGRAVLMARRLGFYPVNWAAPRPSYYRPSELAFYYFREVFAMIEYIPKFLKG